ncbi:MAG: diguanylate cyclase [Treponema sp.]|nr:diguanylate cyclase [Treponema sp.]
MRSIRTRFVGTCIGVVFLIFALVSAFAFYYVFIAVENHIGQSLQAVSTQKVSELNDAFEDVELAVKGLASYIETHIDKKRFRDEKAYADAFLSDLSAMALYSAKIAVSAKTFFFSPDVHVYGADRTLYLLNPGDELCIRVPYDVTKYSASDLHHVAWYYKPQDLGHAAWTGPYPNFNTEYDASTVSYAIPLYDGGTFFGVVGMDVGVQMVRSIIDNLNYQNSFGFLISDTGDLLYHKDFPGGLKASQLAEFSDTSELQRLFSTEYIGSEKAYVYNWQDERYRVVLNRLKNGMLLAVSVPEVELRELYSKMSYQMIVLFVLTLLCTWLVVNRFAMQLIRPIQTITAAASRIARGELSTSVSVTSKDELGLLADSINKIAVELKEYITFINKQAYSDAMTRCRNKAAYLDRVKVLDLRISEDMADFAVFVFDVNGLKKANDTYGHEYGDMLIKDTASALQAVFKEECIFRTGGDEYVVIEEGVTEETVSGQIALFDEHLAQLNRDNERYISDLAVSKGSAVFNKQYDKSYRSVFTRADEAMYACKAKYYETHEDRRRR